MSPDYEVIDKDLALKALKFMYQAIKKMKKEIKRSLKSHKEKWYFAFVNGPTSQGGGFYNYHEDVLWGSHCQAHGFEHMYKEDLIYLKEGMEKFYKHHLKIKGIFKNLRSAIAADRPKKEIDIICSKLRPYYNIVLFYPITGAKVIIIDDIAPTAICEHTESIRFYGRNFPKKISRKDINIGGIRLKDVGKIDSSTIIAVLDKSEDITNGEKEVSIKKTKAKKKIVKYGFSIQSPDHLSYGQIVEAKVLCSPKADIEVSWEVQGEHDEKMEVDWENLDTSPIPTGIIEIMYMSKEIIKIKGVGLGVFKVIANVRLKHNSEFLSCKVEKTITNQDFGEEIRVYSVVPNTICRKDKGSKVFIYGVNFDLGKIPSDCFQKGISTSVEYASSEMIILNIQQIADSLEAGEERYLTLKYKDGSHEDYVTSKPVIRIAKSPVSKSFIKLFQLETKKGPPVNSLDLIRRGLPKGTQIDYKELFKGNTNIKNEMDSILGGGENGELSPMRELRKKHDEVLQIINGKKKPPEHVVRMFGEYSDSKSKVRAMDFFQQRSKAFLCEMHEQIADIEEIFFPFLKDYAVNFTNKKGIKNVENVVGILVLTGILDLEDAEEIIKKAKEKLKENEHKNKAMSALLPEIAPILIKHASTEVALRFLTAGMAPVLKKILGSIVDKIRKGKRIPLNSVKKNLAKFGSYGNVSEKTLEKISKWDLESIRGIARLTINRSSSRFVGKMVKELGDDAPKFFKLVDEMCEKSKTQVSIKGLKRFIKHRGKKRINAKDLKEFEMVLRRKPKCWNYGIESEEVAIDYYNRNKKEYHYIRDLNDKEIKKRYGEKMPVVDCMLYRKGDKKRAVSIADGSLDYSVTKFEKLVGIKERDNYQVMLDILKREEGIRNEKEFLRRAVLQVPRHHVGPLRAVIASRLDEPQFRALRRNGKLKINEILEMIQPLPHNYY